MTDLLTFLRSNLLAWGGVGVILMGVGCSLGEAPDFAGDLPSLQESDAPSGYQWVRTVVHTHTPFSYDACDLKPNRVDGFVNQACTDHFREAACRNRIDWTFATDHPKDMARFDWNSLFLYEAQKGDEIHELPSGSPYANQFGDCSNGHLPKLSVGVESHLIAIGMENHWGASFEEREKNYGGDTRATRDNWMAQTNAFILIPHSESKGRTVEKITAIAPQGMEIYNIHANVDPKIRKKDLQWPPFEPIASLVTFVMDPWKELIPDFGFLDFLEVHPVYAQKWDFLSAQYQDQPSTAPKIFGYGATDAHENIVPQKASDGFRLDSFARLGRIVSNHVLVPTGATSFRQSFLDVKNALRGGQSWEVFEGLGTPMDLSWGATQGGQFFLPGSELQLSQGEISLLGKVPRLNDKSFPRQKVRGKRGGMSRVEKLKWNDCKPWITLQLRWIPSGESASVVLQESHHTDLFRVLTEGGVYRLEIRLRPFHLLEVLSSFENWVQKEFVWAVSNPIWIRP